MKKIIKLELEESDALQLLRIIETHINNLGRQTEEGKHLPLNIWVDRVKSELEIKLSDAIRKFESMIKHIANGSMPSNQ